MAVDKAVDSAVLDAGLTRIADAIRNKAGRSDSLEFPESFVDAIGTIEGGTAQNPSATMLYRYNEVYFLASVPSAHPSATMTMEV